MKFKKKKFRQNKSFFIFTPIIIIIVAILSIFINAINDKSVLKIEELTNGQEQTKKLVINEIMTSNKGAYKDEFGKLYDYIELYNGKDRDLNLKGYGLSDTPNSVKWSFPDITIKSKSYLLVFLSGTNDDSLYASFKLKSAGGESLTLRDANGKIVDSFVTVGTLKNTVMARNLEGTWVIQAKPTPGYANTTKGYEDFQKSLIGAKEDLVINEILPNNKGNFKDNYGNYSGYIEITNTGNEIISLKDYGLSNEEEASFKWQFPDIKIKPDEIILVYTSNRNITVDNLHASFKLNNENGIVILSNDKGKIINKVTYQDIPNGLAYIRESKGYEIGSSISPGYINNITGIEKFESSRKINNTLIINEAMNSNYKYLSQSGNYYDWIELKNNSDKKLNLNKYYLTTNTDNMKMYQLPNKELNVNSYYVVIASGNTKLSNNNYQHTNFKLGEVECIYLTDGTSIIDTLFMAEVPIGYSVGKGRTSGIYYFSNPTPKSVNGSGIYAVSYTPIIKTKPGIYNDVKNVKVEIKGEGTIYYTTNGSDPTTSSNVYQSPLNLKKTTVIKVMSKSSGKLKSTIVTASYVIDERHSLPVVSVSLNQNDFINLNNNKWASGYEKKAHVEYFEKDKEGFSSDIGLQLFGSQAREYAKKSYELTFKKKYGSGNLEYQVFDNRDFSSFDNLILRTGVQGEFPPETRKNLIKDTLSTSIVEEYTDIDVRTFKYCILYINGKYWGLYAIREKIDENMISNHYNVDGSKTDMVRIDGVVKLGNRTKFNKLMSYVRNHSMSNDKYYQEVEKMLNIENFIDFWIAEQWIGNEDMVNVMYFSNPNVDNGRFRMVFYDLDRTFYTVSQNSYQFTTRVGGMGNGTGYYYSTELLRSLMKSKKFKTLYLERLKYNLENVWSEKNVMDNFNEITSLIRPEVSRNFKKWGNSLSHWEKQNNRVKNYIKNRNSYMKKYAKSYFGLSNSEYKKYFG